MLPYVFSDLDIKMHKNINKCLPINEGYFVLYFPPAKICHQAALAQENLTKHSKNPNISTICPITQVRELSKKQKTSGHINLAMICAKIRLDFNRVKESTKNHTIFCSISTFF